LLGNQTPGPLGACCARSPSLVLSACQLSERLIKFSARNGLHALRPKVPITREPDTGACWHLQRKHPALSSRCMPNLRAINKELVKRQGGCRSRAGNAKNRCFRSWFPTHLVLGNRLMDPSVTWHPGAISLVLLGCKDSDCRHAIWARNGLHALRPKKLIAREPDTGAFGRLLCKVPILSSLCMPTLRAINKVFGTQWVARAETKSTHNSGTV
jgi:hypothetical protein